MNIFGGTKDQAARARAEEVCLDHAVMTEADLEWLAPARRITFWAVKVPDAYFSRLPVLEWLDVRGGSGETADFVEGCTNLRYLAINQVRGLGDLSAIAHLPRLERLDLYGLPQVRSLPSLDRSRNLRRIEVGSMKGIAELAPLLDAPNLEELLLARAVSLSPSDPALIASHPVLKAFEWFAEDVPVKVWAPVVELVDKPKAKPMLASAWFEARA